MSVLAVDRVSKAFGGVRAVSDVSFAVDAGELLAMIGPNGAGKSTCFNLVNGQLAPDSGRILLAGAAVQGRSPRQIFRMGVGRTFQIAATFGSMSVRENVQLALASSAHRLGGFFAPFATTFAAEADRLLGDVGMQDQAARHCAVLAYGDLKRLELAIALANRPRLLLMDEPTAGMSSAERDALMALVAGIARSSGVAVLFTEHDMDVVFRHADRVVVLAAGRLIAGGAPADVRADPEVRRVYLGEEPVDA